MHDIILPESAKRVLVYRLGSIGDTVVALPCLHLIRRRFPGAEIALMTNRPVESRAAPMASILDDTGLVDRYISYPISTRRIADFMELRRSIRTFAPDVLIYLVSRPTFALVIRDYLFFRLCGIQYAIGFPFTHEQRACRPPSSDGGLWESEANRLARCLAALGTVETDRPSGWDLQISERTRLEAGRLLDLCMPYVRGAPARLVGLSIGTKQIVNDWGDDNWRMLVAALADPALCLVLIGSGEDRERSRDIARDWPGPVINLCGRAAPRISAAIMERLAFLVCVDSGPMHLAAAVGTRCVAVFSRLNPPGQWFPFGTGHKILYPPENPLRKIEPSKVIGAARELLASEPATVEAGP